MPTQKAWYESRTIWYAILTGVACIVTAFATQYPEIALLGTANTLITIVLRLISNTNIQA